MRTHTRIHMQKQPRGKTGEGRIQFDLTLTAEGTRECCRDGGMDGE